jgi:poly(3-hydroxybutyrate) depolymerase
MRRPVTRLAAAALVALVAGCGGGAGASGGERGRAADPWRLDVARRDGGGRCAPGTTELSLGGRRALLQVNRGGAGRRTLLLSLHGAGGAPRGGLWLFRAAERTPGLVILAPGAVGNTWDFRGGDTVFLGRALERALARCPVDRRRVAVGGFSDGATLALTLGLANGDLFRAIVALSPGGVLSERWTGRPRVFVAHGRRDDVLPLEQTSGRIVPPLRDAGYRVTFRRFGDGHRVPLAISRAAVRWLVRD